jgi:hypothetical protein
MSIFPNGTSVNITNAPRFTVHPAPEYSVYSVVEETIEPSRYTVVVYTVRYSGMYSCDCPARYRLASKCPHILMVARHRLESPPEQDWAAPKPPAPPKRVRLVQKGRAPLPPVHRIAEHHAQLGREIREFEAFQRRLRAEFEAREGNRVWDEIVSAGDPRIAAE